MSPRPNTMAAKPANKTVTDECCRTVEPATTSGARNKRQVAWPNLQLVKETMWVRGHEVTAGVDLAGADLTDCNLRSADLSESWLGGAVLSGSDLSGA
ncbi:MAG TPA: hypothetical protein DCR10_01780, partial [Acidimicrobiaceae bacterium]|nr:hypothetical protein [Acidimicrobiaceae bacterium]